MSKSLNTNTILIYWKMWGWKTLFWSMLSSDYIWRIFWNFSIFQEVKWNKKKISVDIKSIDQLKWFYYSSFPWIILFDEMWLNFNSKNHWTDKNKKLSDFFFIVRKFNLSTIFISQRFTSIPVDMRELADYIFEVSIIHRKDMHPLFRITRQKLNWEWFLDFVDEYIFDIISYNKKIWISYDTLESSIIL